MNHPTTYNRSVRLRDPFFNGVFDRFFGDSALDTAPSDQPVRLTPRVDILEDEHQYQLVADLPGFKKDDVHVTVNNGVLTLKAEHVDESLDRSEENGVKVIRSERHSGYFERQFSVDDSIDIKKMSAELKDGVLNVTLPKIQPANPETHRVSID